MFRRATLFGLLLLLPASAFAATRGRLVLPEGRAAAGTQISIPGIPGSVRADANGEFIIDERARVPFVLVVIGTRGEIFPPVPITELVDGHTITIQLEPTLRESVTVMSGVAPNIEAPPAAGVSLVGREDLEERRPEHLVDTLVRVPGIEIRGTGPAAVPVVRGLAGGRTLLMLDDARVTTERRAGPSGTFLDPFTLGSVEVSRGPGSVAYGSDALGGVIHARPRDPVVGESALTYEVTVATGARTSRSGGVEFTHGLGSGAFLGMVRARSADDSQDGRGRTIENSSYEDRGAALRFVLPSTRGMFRAGLAIDRGEDTEVPAADIREQRTVYPEEISDRLTLSYDTTPASVFDTLEMRGAVSRYDITTNRERLPDATTTRQIASAAVRAKDVSLRFTGTRITSSGRLHTGIDFVTRFGLRADGFTQSFSFAGDESTRVHERSIEDAWKRDLGVFLILDWQIAPALVLSAGGRLDRVDSQNSDGFFGDRSRSDTAPSGYISASYTPVTNATASLQASSGYRDPTLSDRYFRGVSGRGFVVGNPDLDPERSFQYDGAIRWQNAKRSIALLGYHYTIEDLIERFRNGDDFNFRNRGEAVVKGLELEFATTLPLRLSLAINATVARGEADGTTALDDIPAPNSHTALRWSNDRFSAFVHGFFFGRDDRPGPVEVERPGYATVDVGFGWRIVEAAEVRLHVRNAGDRTFIAVADANASYAPGRDIVIGLNGKF